MEAGGINQSILLIKTIKKISTFNWWNTGVCRNEMVREGGCGAQGSGKGEVDISNDKKIAWKVKQSKTKKVELEMKKRNTKLAIMGTAKEEGPGQVVFRWETVEE